MTIGYLIDPEANTVQRVTVGDYKTIYKWIGCDCFDVARFAQNGDGCFVDDEGLLVQRPPTDFFVLPGYPEPLAGKGLVMGVDDEGESISPKTPWDEFVKGVAGATIIGFNGGGIGVMQRPLTVLDDILPLPGA